MGKLYWTVVVLTVVTGLGIAITFGLQGKTVPKIKWSHFADAQEVAQSVELRLSQELRSYDMVFIGPHPANPLHVESSAKILQWLKSQGPSLVVADPNLLEKMNIEHDISLNLMQESDRFLEGMQKVPPGTRVIVWAPNIYVTHLVSSSPINKMQDQLKNMHYIVLSFMTFPESKEAEKDFEIPCATGETDASGFAELGCFIREQSRANYRKEKIENKSPGYLNQVRTHEFMFFLGH